MKRILSLLLILSACGPAPINQINVYPGTGAGHVSPSAGTVLSVPYVLDFSAENDSPHLYCGPMWPASTDITPHKFFWEFWAAPRQAGSTYPIVGGYGGAHDILIGFTQNGTGTQNRPRVSFAYDGTNSIVLDSDDGLLPTQWGHVAATWDGYFLRLELNGIVIGQTAHTGNRVTPTTVNGGGNDLFIGNAGDHSAYDGLLAQVRAWDTALPLDYPMPAFRPQRFFGSDAYDGAGTWTPADLVLSMMSAGVSQPFVEDLSANGYRGRRHNCDFQGSESGGGVGRGFGSSYPAYPVPSWVLDTTAPFASTSAGTEPGGDYGSLPSLPSSALVFDSFNRANATLAWAISPTLGVTDSRASLGSLTWQQGNLSYGLPYWGLLNGRGVYLGQSAGITWVNLDRSDSDIRVSRTNGGNGTGKDIGLAWRVQDRSNAWTAFTEDGELKITDVVNGIWGANWYQACTLPGSWTTIRVVANGGTFSFYADSTYLCSQDDHNEFRTATGVGLMSSNRVGSKITSGARYENFTVFGL
jgi:hypothetical protein